MFKSFSETIQKEKKIVGYLLSFNNSEFHQPSISSPVLEAEKNAAN